MTIAPSALEALSWEPPGPGTWELDRLHWPRPATAHLLELLPAIDIGFREASSNYGWLVAGFDLRPVNRFVYAQFVIAKSDEFGERFERSERAMASKRWRQEVEDWDIHAKPAALERHRALVAVEPAALDDDELIAYLAACHGHHWEMFVQHHRFNGTHMIPVGDFLAGASEWTELPPNRIAFLLRGASPISRGWCAEAERLVSAIRREPRALALVEDEAAAPSEVFRRLPGLIEDINALDDWLFVTGTRIIEGFDVVNPTGRERPGILLACIRAALLNEVTPSIDADLAEVRAAVPVEHRADFDERFEEARFCYRIRDERGIYCDAIAAGIARRAMLATGERLVDHDILPSAHLALQATVDELAGLIRGPEPALVEDLARRREFQASATVADAPLHLGDPPRRRGSMAGFPPAVARQTAALLSFAPDAGESQPEPAVAESGERALKGIGVSSGTHRGVARLVLSPDDFDKLEEGDVLVTITTGEAFNVAIAMVSAVVTDQGNLMCHAAITTRECGIPAVVGTMRATSLIRDGAVVEVDGTTGVVRWS